MATFTWTLTSGSPAPTAGWETAADWVDATGTSHPTTFTTSPGADYSIGSSNPLTINEIGAGGTAAPDIANSLTLSDVQGNLLFHDGGGALDVSTTLSLNSLLNLGTATGGSVLSMGSAGAAGGTITLTASGRIEGGLGDSIQNLGSTPTQITGSGTIFVPANDGIFSIGTGVQVASDAINMKFSIPAHATLAFADAVSAGTVLFTTKSGSGVLDVGALSSFSPTAVKNLNIGVGANTETTVIDFINVGTTATATLSDNSTTGATLHVFANGTSHPITLLGSFTTVPGEPGNFVNVNYLSDGNGGIDVFLSDTPCYAAGTTILTPDGEVPVETIRSGDTVMITDHGRMAPGRVVWAGVREIDLANHSKPAADAPIRFRRDSLGPDQPKRDLLLSPDHCLFLDGGLVPARLLINGMTIIRDFSFSRIAYHHLELERHALLIAEGVAAESYLDTGNRAYFDNASLTMVTHPEFAINAHLNCWQTDACAPLLTRPEDVQPIWRRLADRAASLGFIAPGPETTDEPALRLTVDGKTLWPLTAAANTVTFLMPPDARAIRLRSRSAVPRERFPWLDDPRPLGVAVRSFRLRDRSGETVLPADHPALTDGWHAAERQLDGGTWRWSDGDALLPIVADGPCLMTIDLSEPATGFG
jgi:hypothetical protein